VIKVKKVRQAKRVKKAKRGKEELQVILGSNMLTIVQEQAFKIFL
jgi:hypothetical protein